MIRFPDNFPDTAMRYGEPDPKPKAAAYRGNHKLPHQAQQIRRDLFAESLATGQYRDGLRIYLTTEEFRRRDNCPYDYLVQDLGGMSVTAFRTEPELMAWLEAYGLDRAPVNYGGDVDMWRIVFDTKPMQPLSWRPECHCHD